MPIPTDNLTQLALIALAVVLVLALLLSSYGRWRRRREGDAVIKLVRHEAADNLRRLSEFWSLVRPRESEDELHSVQKVQHAGVFAARDLPPLGRVAFESQRAVLPRYLSASEMRRLVDFYDRIYSIQRLQEELRQARELDVMKAKPGAGEDAGNKYENFMRIAGTTFDKVRHTMDQLLTSGNPLGSRDE